MPANSVPWQSGMAVFSNSAVGHNAEAGSSSVMRQRARIGSRCIHMSELTQSPIGMLQQVGGHIRSHFSWPVCVTSPGCGQTDSEKPSGTIQNTEVLDTPIKKHGSLTGNGSILGEILEDDRRRAAAALSTSAQAVGSSERPMEVETTPTPEMRPSLIDKSAVPGDVPLPRSFLAESVDGNRVECSGRGCRPLYINVLVEYFQLTSTGANRTEVDNSAVKDAFDAALESAPYDARLVSEYAMFTWKSLGNIAAAEELYNKALELAKHDPNILASHALFLWNRTD